MSDGIMKKGNDIRFSDFFYLRGDVTFSKEIPSHEIPEPSGFKSYSISGKSRKKYYNILVFEILQRNEIRFARVGDFRNFTFGIFWQKKTNYPGFGNRDPENVQSQTHL